MINRKALSKQAQLIPLQQEKKVTTIVGTMKTNNMVNLRDIRLLEFDKSCRIEEQKALIFEEKCRYDVILGSNFLTKSGIDIKYSNGTMTWFENTLPMREPWKLDNKEYVAMAESIHISQKDDVFGENWLNSYADTSILEAKYEKVDIEDVAKQQKHLTITQQQELQKY